MSIVKIVINLDQDVLSSVGVVEEKKTNMINGSNWVLFLEVDDIDQFNKIYVPGLSISELFNARKIQQRLALSTEAKKILESL